MKMILLKMTLLSILASCENNHSLTPEQFEILHTRLLDTPSKRGCAWAVCFKANANGKPLKEVYYTTKLVFERKKTDDQTTLYIKFYDKPFDGSLTLTRSTLNQPFDYVYNFPSAIGKIKQTFTYRVVLNDKLFTTISVYPAENKLVPVVE